MSEQTLKLHTEIPEEPHARLVEYLDMVQAELEELVHKVVNCEGENGLPFEDLDVHDKYAHTQVLITDLRGAVLDHAWQAKQIEWKKAK